jgi:hypothetical protein
MPSPSEEIMTNTQAAVEKKIKNRELKFEMGKRIGIFLPKNLKSPIAKPTPVKKQLIWKNANLADYILKSRMNVASLKKVKNGVFVPLAKITSEDRSNEFSFTIKVGNLPLNVIQLNIEGKSTAQTNQKWVFKFKNDHKPNISSGNNFPSIFNIQIPDSSLQYVDYELKIAKSS